MHIQSLTAEQSLASLHTSAAGLTAPEAQRRLAEFGNTAGWEYGEPLARDAPLYLQATTACLAAIVTAQVMNVLLCRHPQRSFLTFGLFSNPLILLGIAAEIGLLLFIVYTPGGNWLFGTAPLEAAVWLVMIALAVLMGVLEEVRKAWVRRSIR